MVGKDKNRSIIKVHLPYCLHPSKGPGVLITTVMFDGKNCDLWERVVRIALKVKNKLGFMKEPQSGMTKSKIKTFSKADAWHTVNSVLCSWILNIIDPKLRLSVTYTEITFGMWEDLKNRY